MKKLVILAVGAILLLGIVAVVAVLLVGDDSRPAATPAPSPAPARPAPLPGATGPRAEAAGHPPGPRRVQVPPGRLKIDLAEPLADCFRKFPVQSSLPAVLTLELEAQSGGGFAVLDSSVKTWGGATSGLVDCARRTLRGQLIRAGSFTPGDRASYDYALEPPPSVTPPVREPPSTSLPASRTQPPRRSGGSR